MRNSDLKNFQIGDILVEPQRNLVRAGDLSHPLEPRIMDVLCLLAHHSGDVVTRDTLINEIWQVEFGGEDSLSRAISLLRKTFREAGVDGEVIETIPKRGYRLAIPAVPHKRNQAASNAPLPAPERPAEHVADTASDDVPAAVLSAPTEPLTSSTAWWRKKRGLLAALIVATIGLGYIAWPRPAPLTKTITVSTVVPAPPRSLAVLPFEDLSAAGDQEYFSDGISEEILNVMTRLDGLQVAGRTSSFAFKKSDRGLKEIGEALSVAYILDGSLRKQDNQLRIQVRLNEAETGYLVWSETYDRSLDDIFVVQDEIARAVSQELNIVLDAATGETLVEVPTTSGQAHDLVLKARAAYRKTPDAETFDRAEAMLLQAVEIDPNYADAWIAIATLNNFASSYSGVRSPKLAFEASRAAIERARAVAPDSAHTKIWAANINYYEGNLVEAYRLAQEAVALEPENEGIVFSVGHYNAIFGYTDRARPFLERATRLDPLDGFAWNTSALVSHNLGEFDRSDGEAQRAIETGDFAALDAMTFNSLAQGDRRAAMKHHMALFEAGAKEADQSLGARLIWSAVGRSIINNSRTDRTAMRTLLATQFGADDFEPSPVSINLAAKLGMFEDFYAQWRPSYAGKATLAISMWSDLEWAQALRNDDGFHAFLEREGFVALWQANGWPETCKPVPGTDGSEGQITCA